jgi:hypothetical protein
MNPWQPEPTTVVVGSFPNHLGAEMRRGVSWLLILITALIGIGCAGADKGANQNKEKPQPAAK